MCLCDSNNCMPLPRFSSLHPVAAESFHHHHGRRRRQQQRQRRHAVVGRCLLERILRARERRHTASGAEQTGAAWLRHLATLVRSLLSAAAVFALMSCVSSRACAQATRANFPTSSRRRAACARRCSPGPPQARPGEAAARRAGAHRGLVKIESIGPHHQQQQQQRSL